MLVTALVLVGLLVFFMRKGDQLKLRTRIVGVVAALLLLLSGVAGVSIFKLNNIGKEIKGIAEQDIPLTEVITKITVKQLEQAVRFERAMLAGEMKDGQKLQRVEQEFRTLAAEVDEEIRRGEALAKQAIAAAHTKEDREEFQYIYEHLGEIGQQHGKFDEHVEQAFVLLSAGDVHQAEQLAHNIETEGDALDHELERFLFSVEKFTEHAALRAEHNEQVAVQILMATVTMALIVGGILGYLLTRGLLRQIGGEPKEMVTVADHIAQGDLSTQFTDTGKETGMYAAMKTMQANLKESIETDRRKAAETGRIKTALDNVSGNVMVADAEGKVIYMNMAVEKMFRDAERQLRSAVPDFSAGSLHGSDLDRLYESLSQQSVRLSQVSSMQSAEFEVGGRTFRTVANPVFNEQGERLGTAVEWTDRTAEVAVEHEVQAIVDYAQAGDLSQRIDLQGKAGFFLKLSEGLNALLEVSERVINDTVRVLGAMAGGDLTETIDVRTTKAPSASSSATPTPRWSSSPRRSARSRPAPSR